MALGRAAEDAAADFLAQQALAIELRNYRCRTGELDIVARASGDVIIIAEVRLRSSKAYGGAAASVTTKKQRRLMRASRHLLATHRQFAHCAVRFDVLELSPADTGFEIHWIKHAFSA
jgi:putative endonuclease